MDYLKIAIEIVGWILVIPSCIVVTRGLTASGRYGAGCYTKIGIIPLIIGMIMVYVGLN